MFGRNKQATLPPELEEQLIKDMIDGQSCYVVPWSITPDTDGKLWLDTKHRTHKMCGGTAEMKITLKDGKYICDVRECRNYRWGRSGAVIDPDRYTPVSKLIY